MAIYSFHIEQISRGNAGQKIAKRGKSIVAMAAYRAAAKLTDERTGITYNYRDKVGVIHKEILAPGNAKEWVFDRSRLWNTVENVEKRSNANLGRQVLIALPKELNREQHIELARQYFKDNFVNKGMVVDFAIHDKGDGNPHCHALITRRELEKDGFGAIRKDWVGGDFKGFVSDERKQIVLELRAAWAEYANRYLEQAGIEASIDHRSLKDQGIDDRIAEMHLGPNVKAMEDKGKETDRGNANQEIKKANKAMKELKQEEVVVLNEYKAVKAMANKLKGIWSDFTQKERDAVLKAGGVLKRYVTLENIESGYRYLDKSMSFWYGLDEKLSRKMKPLNEANSILHELKDCRFKLKEAGFFAKERNSQKENIRYLENRFKNKIEYIEKYYKYGIYDEGSFEKVFKKLESEALKKSNNYEQSRNKLLAKKEILYEAEEALKSVECKKLARTYSDYEKYIHKDNYAAAHTINEFNKLSGKKLSFEEIEMLGDKANKILDDKQRLDRAEILLSEYEKLSIELYKYDNGFNHFKKSLSQSLSNEYNKLVLKLEGVNKDLANFKVSDRADYAEQREVLSKEIDSLPPWLKNYDLNNKEQEYNSKLYRFYMERQRYREANEFYMELNNCRNKLRKFNGTRDDKQELKEKIRNLETSFLKCKVGREKDFDYVSVVNDMERKKKILEGQFNESIKNVDVSEGCKIACKARNSVIDIQNKKSVHELYFADQIWLKNNDPERISCCLKNVHEQYKNEYPAIKHISERAAVLIDDLNKSSGKPLTINEIMYRHKEVGKTMEDSTFYTMNVNNTNYKEFKILDDIVKDLRYSKTMYDNYERERKVVNGNEHRPRNIERSYRGDQEAYGRTSGVSSPRTGRSEGPPDQRSGYSESIPGISEIRQRKDSRKLQQNSGRNKYSSSENGREVLETTAGGTTESSRFSEKQQVGDNFGVKTNDREVSAKDRITAISKGNNSSIGSRFKSNLSNTYSNTASGPQLNDQLRKQIEMQKAEISKLSEDELQKTKENKHDKNKPKERER